jgi:uncharacterized protein
MDLAYIITFFVTFAACILSGIAGGGGSFITAPYWLISGMTPAQGATTGGFMAIGMGASSLLAFGKTNNYPRNKKLTVALVSITVISSIVGSFVLTRIDVSSFKNILAIITILSIPLLFIDRKNINLSRSHQKIGVMIFVILLFVSSIITSSAFSVLIAVGLVQLFNLSIIESIATRRLIGLLQSIIIFGILAWQGNFLIFHGIAAIIGGSIGSYFGTRFAIKKGEGFAKYALAIGALVGAVALIW